MDPISVGTAGPEVEDVQRRLEALGLDCAADDPGVLGPATVAAVRAFQQRRGLPADGIVGPDTWRILVGAGFRLGDRILYRTDAALHGDDVLDLQRRLNRLGFDAGYDDGVYGERTSEAVREFQLNAGLVPDSISGPTTIGVVLRMHRVHQEAPAFAVREREQLRRPTRRTLAGARIMVDPAHLPDDPRVFAPDGTPDHEVSWAIANLVQGRLAARGAQVVLGRGPATSPSPTDRARHANDENAEVIVSLRCAGVASAAAHGAAAYYFGTEADVSVRGRTLAEMLLTSVCAATTTPDLRAHPSTAALLRASRAPAVECEVGYLSHPEEGRRLLDTGYQTAIAEAVADAVRRFLIGDDHHHAG